MFGASYRYSGAGVRLSGRQFWLAVDLHLLLPLRSSLTLPGTGTSVAIYLLAGCLISANDPFVDERQSPRLIAPAKIIRSSPYTFSHSLTYTIGCAVIVWNRRHTMNNKGSGLAPAQALDKLDALYGQSVVALRNAIGNYITSGEFTWMKTPANKVFCLSITDRNPGR